MPKTIRVVIADPLPADRQQLIAALNDSGLAQFAVTEAADGMDAMMKISSHPPDLVLTELDMDKLSGVELAREIQQNMDPAPAVGIVTGQADMTVLMQAVADMNPAVVLAKPVRVERLVKSLKPFVQSVPDVQVQSSVEHGDLVPQAAIDIIRSTTRMELRPYQGESTTPDGDVIFGIISMHGDVSWTCVLGLDASAATGLAQAFAGFEIPFDSDDMGDCIGELVNIYGGQVKVLLSKRGKAVEISLPTVISATGIRVRVQRNTAVDHFHFECDLGRIWTGLSVGAEVGLVM